MYRTLTRTIRVLVLWVGFCASSLAVVPRATPEEIARAAVVSQMPDDSPAERINQLLAARSLTRTEQFVLAATHPGTVQQLVDPFHKLASGYLFSLAGIELHKVREGRTLIRGDRSFSRAELIALKDICEHFGHDVTKLRAIRFGPRDGRVYKLEVLVRGKRKKQTITEVMELGWPSTPARDETSRVALTKLFGARPSRLGMGVGSLIPLRDGSFEGALGNGWAVVQGTNFGHHTPVQEVTLDTKVALDGRQSVRFHATERTRQFLRVSQRVPVAPGTRIRLRGQMKAELIRVEFQQRRSDIYIGLSFLGAAGQPIGQAHIQNGRLGSHPWELLEILQEVPPAATHAEISLSSGLSGTAWYDGVSLEVVQ